MTPENGYARQPSSCARGRSQEVAGRETPQGTRGPRAADVKRADRADTDGAGPVEPDAAAGAMARDGWMLA